jgi:hypothetical protein
LLECSAATATATENVAALHVAALLPTSGDIISIKYEQGRITITVFIEKMSDTDK